MTPEALKDIVESVINQKFQYYYLYLFGAIFTIFFSIESETKAELAD